MSPTSTTPLRFPRLKALGMGALSIYALRCIPTGKLYVGQTAQKMHNRWLGHIRSAKRGSHCYIHNAIRKYGTNNFDVWILATAVSPKHADYLETKFIQSFDSTNRQKGYNICSGGYNKRGCKQSKSWIKKMSNFMLGNKYGAGNVGKRRIMTDEARFNMSQSIKNSYKNGRTPWNLGLEVSSETKAKISKSNSGKKAWNKGKRGFRHSKESRLKMSISAAAGWEKRRSRVRGY